ncbi:MAG: archaetidylserine decarboxylase [Planctomycetota bacterium]
MSASAAIPKWLQRLPKRRLSRLVGRAARVELPRWLLRPLLAMYARFYGVRREEMARPLRDYASFVDFFTRTLVEGARQLPEDPSAIVSPADGRIAQGGRIEAGTLIQAKGMPYRLDELLADPGVGRAFEGGTYHVVYLAPGDYHRFHWPFDATIESVHHVTGELWPVNAKAVAAVQRLFAVNERVVVAGRLGRDGLGGRYAFVAVGALDVGSIRLAFQDIETNVAAHDDLLGLALDHSPVQHLTAERGTELGLFELGSTVIVVLAPEAGELDALPAGQVVRMGQRVGVQHKVVPSRRE